MFCFVVLRRLTFIYFLPGPVGVALRRYKGWRFLSEERLSCSADPPWNAPRALQSVNRMWKRQYRWRGFTL